MKINTPHRILATSRAYFNKHGYGAASLYKISQELEISRGNLTYHFKDKESLLNIHLEEMAKRAKDSFTSSLLFPSWETLATTSKEFIQVQKDYAFIFFDKNVLFLPEVMEKMRVIKKIHIKIQMSMIHVSIESGNMRKESIPGQYHNICRTIWQLLFFNLVARNWTEEEESSWNQLMWSLLLPNFTKKGKESFINHFGKEYYDGLGKRYDEFMADVATF